MKRSGHFVRNKSYHFNLWGDLVLPFCDSQPHHAKSMLQFKVVNIQLGNSIQNTNKLLSAWTFLGSKMNWWGPSVSSRGFCMYVCVEWFCPRWLPSLWSESKCMYNWFHMRDRFLDVIALLDMAMNLMGKVANMKFGNKKGVNILPVYWSRTEAPSNPNISVKKMNILFW